MELSEEEHMVSRDLKRAVSGVREPEYIRQSGEVMTVTEAQAWFVSAAEEARSEGCTHARYSYHPSIPNLRIVEGWHQRPEDDGDIRWALTLSPPEHDTSERSVPASQPLSGARADGC